MTDWIKASNPTASITTEAEATGAARASALAIFLGVIWGAVGVFMLVNGGSAEIEAAMAQASADAPEMAGMGAMAGLDRLSFGGEASSLTVAGGRYITDDVYLEIIGGGENGAAVNVEWQVRRNLTVSSKFGGQGDASLSIRWRRESDRPGGDRTDRRRSR